MECTFDSRFVAGGKAQKCFLCNRHNISSDSVANVLELQGLPDTPDERLYILKVLCQLLRVHWDTLKDMFIKSVIFPFCSGCLKSVVKIMSLREQLFEIETELRNQIGTIMSQVVTNQDVELNGLKIEIRSEENQANESYENFRRQFQDQVANEYAVRRLLSSKVEEQMLQGRKSVVLEPSLVQLHLQKNVFHVISNVEVIDPFIQSTIQTFESEQNTGEDAIDSEFSLGLVPFDTEPIGVTGPSKIFIKSTELFSSSVEDEDTIYEKDEIEDAHSDSSLSLADGSSSEDQSHNSDEDIDDKLLETPTKAKRPKISPKITPTVKLQKKRASPKTKTKEKGNAAKGSELVDAKPVAMETYKAKDGTVWTNVVPTEKITKPKCSAEGGGAIGPAKNPALTPVELFKLMFSPDMVDTMVTHTNQFASSIKSDWKPLTREEAYAFIGMLLFLGADKKRHTSVDDIWVPDPKYAVPAIVATMSRHRFETIKRFLRFDDRSQRQINGEATSKLEYISQIFEPFVKNIQSCFCPYDTLVVDEMLIRYKGSVKFRVYMKSKPGKYGVKIWALCDAKTGYVLRLCIYEGKVGESVERELGKKVVLGLVEPYFHTGRRVTTDNFFTSKSLGDELRNQNLTLLGTLNKIRMDVIPEFAEGKKRPIQSSMFAFQDHFTMVSYIQRKNKSVVLLSTAHHDAKIDPTMKDKPQMILDYNMTKGGVDTADMMMQSLSCQRTTRRWPVKLFYAVCDIAALNAYLLFKMRSVHETGQVPRRKTFLRSVAEALIEPILWERSQHSGSNMLPLYIKNALSVMGYPVEVTRCMPSKELLRDQKKGRCTFCPGPARSQKQSRTRCDLCKLYACNDHSIKILHCNVCVKKKDAVSQRSKGPSAPPRLLGI